MLKEIIAVLALCSTKQPQNLIMVIEVKQRKGGKNHLYPHHLLSVLSGLNISNIIDLISIMHTLIAK